MIDTKSALEVIEQIRCSALRMKLQQFRNALKLSIGATKDYADGCWIPFQNDPLNYICSRSHEAQKLELIKLCMRLGKII